MSRHDGLIVLPRTIADRLAAAPAPGSLAVRVDPAENLAVVFGYRPDDGGGHRDRTDDFIRNHYTHVSNEGSAGRYHRATEDLHAYGSAADHLRVTLTAEAFREGVTGRVRLSDTSLQTPVVTYAPEAEEPVPRWRGWWVSQQEAARCPVHVVDVDDAGPSVFQDAWPVDTTTKTRAVMIGVGSIGSAAANSLASYGIGHLTLVDPDVLLTHNVARHHLGIRDVGRNKARATAQRLRDQYPHLEAVGLSLDVVSDANQLRDELPLADVVIVTTDGVESRLAANWLTAHANVPTVFACVLDDGAIGEIVRTTPGAGCLVCNRIPLRAQGLIDPEPSLDLPYGTGRRHRPMTAVGGDLKLMGQLSAKVAVATVLERLGDRSQRIGADHGIVGLRPDRQYPPPFADAQPGSVIWRTFTRDPDCPVCVTRAAAPTQ